MASVAVPDARVSDVWRANYVWRPSDVWLRAETGGHALWLNMFFFAGVAELPGAGLNIVGRSSVT